MNEGLKNYFDVDINEIRLMPDQYVDSEEEIIKRKRENNLITLLELHGPLQNTNVQVSGGYKAVFPHNHWQRVKCPISEVFKLITIA